MKGTRTVDTGAMVTCWMTDYKCPLCGDGVATDGDSLWCVHAGCTNTRPGALRPQDVEGGK